MQEAKEKCGIVGIYGHPEAANLAYLGLYALQHRGQESAGIVSSNGRNLLCHRQMGLVADIFNQEVLARLQGYMAVGHVRYSTSGKSELKNAQPILVNFSLGGMATAHNGNLINAVQIRQDLESHGSIFQSSMD
ncbi:MAG: amidophosphoribosyltransferase, partial [Dehalococcoidales bacterium]